jgi:RNA polymerase sigma factor (sigma-70 family)
VLDRGSDRDLLDRFVADRDEQSFAGLVSRHAPLVMGVSRRILGNAADAEDVFQAAFIVLSRKASSIRHADSISSWLHNVTVRIALRAKSSAEERRTRERRAGQMLGSSGAESQETPAELWRTLDQELGSLPDKFRAPLVLCYLEGMTNEGAARTLGLPSGSMSQVLEKGRELLRRRLASRGVAVSGAVLGLALTEKVAFAVSPAAIASVAKLAVLAAAGELAVSAPVALLVKGGLHALVAAKAKIVAAAVLGACLVGTAVSMVAYASIRPDVGEEASYSAVDVARVERRIAELAPTRTERTIDEIGWAKDFRSARQLATRHGRPLFFVRHDGDLLTGRFDGGSAGLRSGSLADPRVIALLNRCFVPIHAANEDLEPGGGATPEDRGEADRIYREALDRRMPAGLGAVYTVAPDGRVLGSLVVPSAHDTDQLLALLQQARDQVRPREGAALVEPAPHSRLQNASPGDLVLHVVSRYVDAAGAPEGRRTSWHEVPAEDWLVFAPAEAARLLPAGDRSLGKTWTLDEALARRILVHFYPATEDARRDDSTRSRVDRTTLRARLVAIRGDLLRLRLDGDVRMGRRFNKTYPATADQPIEAIVSGYLDLDHSGQILSLKLITERAMFGPSPFAVSVQSHRRGENHE